MTKVQQNTLEDIRDQIAYAKKFDNFKDYYIHNEVRYLEGEADYEEMLNYYTERYEKNGKEIEKYYKKYWLDKLNNIALTHCSSATIRALEKEGYIEIVKDSVNQVMGIDHVKLIIE